MTMNAVQSPPPRNAPKSRITAFPGVLLAALALTIAITSIVSFRIQQRPLKEEARQTLAHIADVKVARFTRWIEEQRQDAQAVSRNRLLGESVARWTASGARADATRGEIERYLADLTTIYKYDGVVLFDRDGEPKLATGPKAKVFARNTVDVGNALRSGQVHVSDFALDENATWLDFYAPLLAADKVVAVVMFRIDAPAFIFPLIQEWPVPSASAETFLVRREGDDVDFLTAPRKWKDAPHRLRLPLSRSDLPAAIAVQGKDGEVEGVDYRGVPVVAALRRIPDTPWHLVAKIDAEEAYEPIRELAISIAAIALLAFFGSGAAVVLWWRAQRAQFRMRESEFKVERLALVRHFDFLAKFANDIIALSDDRDNIIEVNDRAVSESGYSREELSRMNVQDMLGAEGLAKYRTNTVGAAPEGRVFETWLKRKNGSVYPIEVSARAIDVEGRRFNQYIVRNITERKRAEEAVAASEKKYRDLIESVADWVWEVDEKGAYTYSSPKVLDLLGYEPLELIGKTPFDLMPAAEAARVAPIFAALVADRKPVVGLENANLRRDGREVILETNGVPIFDSSGAFRGYRGIDRDISERKRVEREALDQFKLAETFFNHSVSSQVILDRDFNFVRVNEAYAKACRREIGDFAGRNHFEMYPSDTQAIFEEVIRTKRPFATFTRSFVFPDQPERGTTYWDWTLVPILDEQGEIEYLVFSLNEVTDRKRAEENQRAAALYARSLIEASLDPLVTISTAGKITDVNKATEEVTGVGRERLVGTDFADYFTEPDSARTGYREVLERGYVRDYPLTIRHVTGRTTDVLYHAAVYRDAAGALRGVFAAARDITERKQAEAARTQLAAIVQSSHDAIIGKTLDGIITSWNPGAEKVYGYRADEVVGKHVSMLAPEGARDEIQGLLERIGRGEAVMNHETERFRKNGRRIDISIDLSPIRDASDRIVGASTIARDITEKKQAERALYKVNRALKALSNGNTALIHAIDEMQLLNELCRVIVDIEGYRLAWVGYAEHDEAKTVRPVAHSGYAPGTMERADITWADNERGSGPLGIAIRTGQVQVVQDVKADPRFAPWRENAVRLGYGSVLVAPLSSESGVIGAFSIYADGANAFDAAEIALLCELADDMAFGIATLRTRSAHERSAKRLQDSMEATVQVISGTVEMRDPYTAGHQRRVAELATAIARDLGLAQDRVHGVHLAAVVHDLGKIQIPAEILSKPGKLTSLEFELIKTHSEAGYEILKGVDFPWPIAQIVLQHHERLDGSGYPHRLKADEILLEARILTVADVVEAMASHRPYRASLGIDAALEEISAQAGKFYDADVVRVCLALFREKAFKFSA